MPLHCQLIALIGASRRQWSLARAITTNKGKWECLQDVVTIMLIRGQWDGPVTSEYCDEMG